MHRISALSKEYIRVPVAATEDGVAVNPTADTVTMAAVASGGAPSFVAAEWETSGTTFYARVLVGPGTSAVLTAGRYDAWVKVTDNPEVPAINAGPFEVY